MNVRPVPARGGATRKTSVSQRQEYIPESKAGRRNLTAVP